MTRSEWIRVLDAEFAERREADAVEDQRRRAEAEARCPGLKELLDGRQQLIYGGIQGLLRHEGGAEQLPARMAALNRDIAAALKRGGLPEDYLDPVAQCPLCRDSGYVGSPVRRRCDCYMNELNRKLYAELADGENAEASFERFDASIFPEKPVSGGKITQRRLMAVIRAQCEAYANGWPEVAQKDVLLAGASGLGKTYLMNCIGRRLIERGRDVLTVSAYRYQQMARAAYFGESSEALNALLNAEVLLLDDLGSEPLMANITIGTLLNLINERRAAGRGTVYTTNLTDRELQERYTERVSSRLLDTRNCLVMHFEGDDLRRR